MQQRVSRRKQQLLAKPVTVSFALQGLKKKNRNIEELQKAQNFDELEVEVKWPGISRDTETVIGKFKDWNLDGILSSDLKATWNDVPAACLRTALLNTIAITIWSTNPDTATSVTTSPAAVTKTIVGNGEFAVSQFLATKAVSNVWVPLFIQPQISNDVEASSKRNLMESFSAVCISLQLSDNVLSAEELENGCIAEVLFRAFQQVPQSWLSAYDDAITAKTSAVSMLEGNAIIGDKTKAPIKKDNKKNAAILDPQERERLQAVSLTNPRFVASIFDITEEGKLIAQVSSTALLTPPQSSPSIPPPSSTKANMKEKKRVEEERAAAMQAAEIQRLARRKVIFASVARFFIEEEGFYRWSTCLRRGKNWLQIRIELEDCPSFHEPKILEGFMMVSKFNLPMNVSVKGRITFSLDGHDNLAPTLGWIMDVTKPFNNTPVKSITIKDLIGQDDLEQQQQNSDASESQPKILPSHLPPSLTDNFALEIPFDLFPMSPSVKETILHQMASAEEESQRLYILAHEAALLRDFALCFGLLRHRLQLKTDAYTKSSICTDMGVFLIRQGQAYFDFAESSIKRAIFYNRYNHYALQILALLYILNGQYQHAEIVCDLFTEGSAVDQSLKTFLLEIKYNPDDLEEDDDNNLEPRTEPAAEGSIQISLSTSTPGEFKLCIDFAEFLFSLNILELTEVILSKISDTLPTDLRRRKAVLQTELHMKQGLYQQASESLQSVSALDDKKCRFKLLELHSQLLWKVGKKEDALRHGRILLKKSLKGNPPVAYPSFLTLQRLKSDAVSSKRYIEARQIALRQCSIVPGTEGFVSLARINIELAKLHKSAEYLKEATHALTIANHMDRSNAEVWQLLSLVKSMDGNIEQSYLCERFAERFQVSSASE